MSSELYEAICKVVTEIPRGRVATYGQVARLAGYPRHSRFVSKAMVAASSEQALCWYRVLNSQGKSSLKGDAAQRQFDLLAEEGVEAVLGKVSLGQYQWDPVFDGMMDEWIKPDE